MSWSINAVGTADEVAEQVDKNEHVPDPIKDYIGDGIEALRKRWGEDVSIALSGSGHLHNGEEGNWDSTTANINVSKKT